MKSANPQFGLVLTGGGAKGAYQVGAPHLRKINCLNHEVNKIAVSCRQDNNHSSVLIHFVSLIPVTYGNVSPEKAIAQIEE